MEFFAIIVPRLAQIVAGAPLNLGGATICADLNSVAWIFDGRLLPEMRQNPPKS
jgi:hypothetical protein